VIILSMHGATLSVREREVPGLVGPALSNGRSPRSFFEGGNGQQYLRNIFVKLGFVSRIDAVSKAAELRASGEPAHRRELCSGELLEKGLP
jgi:ATP/maltotriose-dependent transcriptional regulator MalT